MKRFCVATVFCTAASKVLMAVASDHNSRGAEASCKGARSVGARPSTCWRKRAKGDKPARMPSHTISVINSTRLDMGSNMSTKMRWANSSRLALLRATCTSMVCGALTSSPKRRYKATSRRGWPVVAFSAARPCIGMVPS